MAQGRDNMSQGDIQAGVRKFERAIGRAPDVPTYYPFLANVYSAYADNIHNDLVPREAECDLRSQGNAAAYRECLNRKAFDIKQRAVELRPLYVRTQMNLADAALELELEDPEAYPPEAAILHQQKVAQTLPHDGRARTKLAVVYLRLDRQGEALQPLKESLEITEGTPHSSYPLYLRGLAQADMGDLESGAVDMERSLELDGSSPWSGEIHKSLVQAYTGLGRPDLAQGHARADSPTAKAAPSASPS